MHGENGSRGVWYFCRTTTISIPKKGILVIDERTFAFNEDFAFKDFIDVFILFYTLD